MLDATCHAICVTIIQCVIFLKRIILDQSTMLDGEYHMYDTIQEVKIHAKHTKHIQDPMLDALSKSYK